MSKDQTAQTQPSQCEARIHDPKLPSNTAQIRQCRAKALDGAKFCRHHIRPHDAGYMA